MSENVGEIFLAFDETENNFVLFDGKESKPPKADQEIAKFLEIIDDCYFQQIERTELIELLKKETKWQERKIEDCLKKIVDKGLIFEAQFGKTTLVKE
jgi:hypothetical protein